MLLNDEELEMLKMRKDPRQIFFGLQPGSIISLKDEVVIKPQSD